MSGTRITIDGLWRCLCPSIDEVALSKAVSGPTLSSSRLTPQISRRRPSICTARWRARPFHNSAFRFDALVAEAEPAPFVIRKFPYSQNTRDFGANDESTIDNSITVDTLINSSAREVLRKAPTPVVYDALRILMTRKNSRGKIRALVKYVVVHRQQAPNVLLYEALIRSNWDTAGSAKEVRFTLDEMKNLGVPITSAVYNAALRALAVHPDYLLRNRIIAEMREKWIELNLDAKCSIAVGILRDGQRELAVEKLEQFREEEGELLPWVYDIFIFVLTQHGAIDEALRLLELRSRQDNLKRKLTVNTWYFLLDEASRMYHYEGTKIAWERMVLTNDVVPSDGMCLNILNTAARYTDAKLATEVIQYLSSRNVKLGAHHYEALVECYANRDDVDNALQALCIMGTAGIQPSHATACSVAAAFRRSPNLARGAHETLERLGESHTVPLAALNAVLDGLGFAGYDKLAFDLYQEVRHLCGCAPDARTFAALMEHASNLEIARYLMDEMPAFGVKPSVACYDRLIYLAVTEGEQEGLDLAFRTLGQLLKAHHADLSEYRWKKRGLGLQPAKAPKEWIGKETVLAVAKRCVAERDERLWILLEHAWAYHIELGPEGRKHLGDSLVQLPKKSLARARTSESSEEVHDKEIPDWLADLSTWAQTEMTAQGSDGEEYDGGEDARLSLDECTADAPEEAFETAAISSAERNEPSTGNVGPSRQEGEGENQQAAS